MARIGPAIAVILFANAVALGAATGQTAAPAPNARAGVLRAIEQKMPACRKQANAQRLTLDARRSFMRQCLRS
jgi:hypothetical protein